MVNHNRGLDATFQALADPTRRAILSRLATGEATVKELAQPFAMSLPAVSRHLKVLREAGLIDSERRGTWVYYRRVPAALERMAGLLSAPVS